MAMTMLEARRVTGGVDTHLDVHVAAALDPSVASSARSRSRSTLPATNRCSHGSRAPAPSERSVSKEPVPMEPGSHGFFANTA